MSVALPFKYLLKSSKLIWRLNDVNEDDTLSYIHRQCIPAAYLKKNEDVYWSLTIV